MASVPQLVARMTANREKIMRYAWIPQLFGGLVFLGLGYFMGRAHFHLIRQGVRAPGAIVGYKQESFRNSSGGTSSTSTSYMPIVEFHTRDRFVQFQDWLGAHVAGNKDVPVTVLYDPAIPTIAMIDRPVWNWIPWAPTLAVGFLLTLSAINRFFRADRPRET
ncbi:MAG TPA: DUF3592 domain-containing protein [Candidatus Acidoferrum sp.]|nr:DUF3592 domain-containing protein [Candidatus Acidoferrum sp.]